MKFLHRPQNGPGSSLQGPHWLRGPEEVPPPAELPDNFFALRLVLQPGGAFVEVNRPEMLVGRHSEADIRLPLPDVSRRHCRLQFIEGCWQVFDLHSLNGVYVNGEQVMQAPIDQGDLLRIGGFTFSVEVDRPESENQVHSFIKAITQPPPQRKAS